MADLPVRVQRKRTKGWRMQNASPNGLPVVYVGRGGRYGNEFRIGDDLSYYLGPGAEQATAAQCVELYENTLEAEITADPQAGDLMKAKLRGKNLACFCHLCPKHAAGKPFDVECPDCDPCHADPLGILVNRPISNAASHTEEDRAHVQV